MYGDLLFPEAAKKIFLFTKGVCIWGGWGWSGWMLGKGQCVGVE